MARERPRQRSIRRKLLSVLALLWSLGCGDKATPPAAPARPDAAGTDSAVEPRDAGGDQLSDRPFDSVADAAEHSREVLDTPGVDLVDQGGADRGAPDVLTTDAGVPAPGGCARAAPDRPGVNGRPPYLDLVVNGAGFESHEGQRVHVLARDYHSQLSLGYGSAVVVQGRFVLRFPRGYATFSYQPMFFYVDVDNSGDCDPAVDHLGAFVTSGHTGGDPYELELSEQRYGHDSPRPRADASVCTTLNACR